MIRAIFEKDKLDSDLLAFYMELYATTRELLLLKTLAQVVETLDNVEDVKYVISQQISEIEHDILKLSGYTLYPALYYETELILRELQRKARNSEVRKQVS